MNHLRACTCVLAILALAGCTAASQGSQQVPATGHLTGVFVMEGGPLGPGGQQPGERPLAGTVTLTEAGRRQVTIQVGASGRFSAWLPPGRYEVSGRTPSIEEATSVQAGTGGNQGQEQPCSRPLTVTITARHTANITLACIVP